MIDCLIPCRDGGDYHLAALIRSLEAQSVDVNIDVEFGEGAPLYQVRNRLLKRNRGEFVYFVDADDWLPNKQSLKKLLEVLEHDFAWGDLETYVTPLDKTIHIDQSTMSKLALGSWMARRSSFPMDPWAPMPNNPHRSDWEMPWEWVGNYVHYPIFTYRVAWSPDQLTAEPKRNG